MDGQFIPRRQRPPPPAEGLYEGVPPGLRATLVDWLMPFFRYRDRAGNLTTYPKWLQEVERKLNVELGDYSFDTRLDNLFDLIRKDDELFLYVVDHFLAKFDNTDKAEIAQLAKYFKQALSVWEVVEHDGSFYLERRVARETAEAFERATSVDDRAALHLRKAWSEVYGRQPDPSTAYRESVRAIEAIAKPVILPMTTTPRSGR